MIEYKKISVVIQGALTSDKYREESWIKISCQSIRSFLPGAEIIVSTWKGSDTEGIDCDVLVLNDDPGSLSVYYEGSAGNRTVNNINRQIVSTVEGIKKATGKYVMKLRSDSYVLSTDFLKYYDKYGENSRCDITRILVFEPRNPWGIFYEQFCLCDFWFFGEKETVLKLWDIPLYSSHKTLGRDLLGEEYIYQEFEKTHRKYYENKKADVFSRYVEIIRKYFVIIPTRKSGIKSFKYPALNSFFDVNIKHYVLSHSDWIYLTYGRRKSAINICIAVYIQRYFGNLFLFLKDRIYEKEK